MTVRIRFEELTLQTSANRYSYAFPEAITPIVGPVGSGKTSLLELLKYGIGGSGALSQAVQSAVQGIILRVTFPDQTLVFARRIGATTVDVHTADGALLETIATRNSKHHRLASLFLLEAAGLPAMTVARTRGRGTGRVENLTFFDVYRYCYLPQSEIDRSVVRHLDPLLARRRKATFEMLFGLADIHTAAADARVAELTDALSVARINEGAVRRFLEQAEETTEVQLLAELDKLTGLIASSQDQLSALRDDMRQVTADEANRQRRVAELAAHVRTTNQQAMLLQSALHEHANGIAQYEVQLERLTRTHSARRALDAVEFSRCPRCLQSVRERQVTTGLCLLCTQPEPPRHTIDDFGTTGDAGQIAFGEVAVNDERRKLESLRDEVRSLAAEDQKQLDDVLTDQRGLEVTMREVLTELDRRTKEYISPRFEAISELSAQLATAESRQSAVRTALGYWERCRALSATVTELQQQIDSAKAAAVAAHLALEERRSILVELSNTFNEIIQLLEPPWYENAYIESTNYVPVLNGSDFESLSGGEKTIVNLAYHLALLTTALARRDTLVPALLVIDTPRKNLGAGEDQAIAERTYRQIQALADAYNGGFQLIIADNDPPPIVLPHAKTIRLDYTRPLIPDLEHPGPDVETLSGTSD